MTVVDYTPGIPSQAKTEATLAEADDIEWKGGNAENLPFGVNPLMSLFQYLDSCLPKNPQESIKEVL